MLKYLDLSSLTKHTLKLSLSFLVTVSLMQGIPCFPHFRIKHIKKCLGSNYFRYLISHMIIEPKNNSNIDSI